MHYLLFDELTAVKAKQRVPFPQGTRYHEKISILEASVLLSDVIKSGKRVLSSWEQGKGLTNRISALLQITGLMTEHINPTLRGYI